MTCCPPALTLLMMSLMRCVPASGAKVRDPCAPYRMSIIHDVNDVHHTIQHGVHIMHGTGRGEEGQNGCNQAVEGVKAE